MGSLIDDYHDALGLPHREVPLPIEEFPLDSVLPVAQLALGSVAAVAMAAERRAQGRAALPRPPLRLDAQRVAAAFASDRLLRIGGEAMDGFAPSSGFFAAADGWVRTHGNYPHHRQRLLALLGLGASADREDIVAAIAERPAQDIEDDAARAGAIAVRVRAAEEWAASDAGRASSAGPLVSSRIRDDGGEVAQTRRGTPRLPLAGIRVLDLTRVLAGPVASRTLALLGAEVLRVDPPEPSEIGWQHLDNGQGKRSTIVDLNSSAGFARMQRLLDGADVFLSGYRPGSLDRFGLRPPPGVIVARISAWGEVGPWAPRRGFDSIVQAASGISLIEGSDDRPGALPAQALDHGTGYLTAAAIIDAIALRDRDGLGRELSLSLARTAHWLLDAERGAPGGESVAWRPGLTVRHGDLETVRPALVEFDDYAWPAHPWGSDPAYWEADSGHPEGA
ncbi:CoA transferase [Parafrigoribacterium soli]|uniref:CoA transferase n=1 Tax=Parafrigoribacterium soli TaxID=3144663 RepID=UPI0032EBA66A